MLAPEHPAYPRVVRRSALHRHRRLVAAALAALALLPGDAVRPAVARDRDLAAQVRAVLPELQAFVERERGLPFRRPVRVELLSEAAFLAELGAPVKTGADDDVSATLAGLGQLGDGEELSELVDGALDGGVTGIYTGADRLVVRGAHLDEAARLVLVHELVHALQDQHGLFAQEPPGAGDDERPLAFSTLVEGDATAVEHAWQRSRPAAVRAELGEPSYDWAGGSGVLALDVLDLPYLAGPALVRALRARGGQAALDAAYRHPPTSTAEVLHPGRPAAPGVAAPPVEGEVVDRGVLGELGLASLLGEDPLEGSGPQRAWDGDGYVTVRSGAGTCTHAAVQAGTRPGRDELLRALRRWAGDQADAEVGAVGDRGLRLRSCT